MPELHLFLWQRCVMIEGKCVVVMYDVQLVLERDTLVKPLTYKCKRTQANLVTWGGNVPIIVLPS